jgi:N-acetylglucosamine kinase-like BadF-type ATPase
LAEIVAVVAHGHGSPVDTVSAGVSGLTHDNRVSADLHGAVTHHGVGRVLLAHDSITSYLGALGDERGVVVASGTGVVTLAVGEARVARVDGWGYLIGDAGSGYWLGRAALDAVMRAHDGRAPATALTDIVRADFIDLEHAYIELQSDANRVRRVAAYARMVADLAATDEVASRICDEAAAELVLSAATGLRRVGEDARPDPVVCGIGGVFRSVAIATRFAHGLAEIWPGVDIRTALGDGRDGAMLLPRLAEHSALGAMVATARG